MSAHDDGGPAFPFVHEIPPREGFERAFIVESGMTLRDYFAAKAMHALLVEDGTVRFHQRAIEAYEMADAMLAERAKVQP